MVILVSLRITIYLPPIGTRRMVSRPNGRMERNLLESLYKLFFNVYTFPRRYLVEPRFFQVVKDQPFGIRPYYPGGTVRPSATTLGTFKRPSTRNQVPYATKENGTLSGASVSSNVVMGIS